MNVRIICVSAVLTAASLAGTPARLLAQHRPPDNPQAREAWFLRGRRSPDSRPPAYHLRRALGQRRAVRFAQRRAAAAPSLPNFSPTGTAAWKELGPRPLNTSGSLAYAGGPPEQDYGPVSGRVTAIAIDPADASGNTIYVGAAFGGLWKSTNALGASPAFTPLTDSALTLSVGAIGLDASTSPTTIFIGTGEPNGSDSYYGEGILESTDGGNTWTQVAATDGGAGTFAGMGFYRILFDAQNPAVVLAAVTGDEGYYSGTVATVPGPSGIYRSTDHGATWVNVLTVAGADSSATDIAYDPAAKVYYAAISGAGIYKSTDQGATWTAVASPFANGVPATSVNGGTVEFFRASLAVRAGTVYALIADSTGNPATPTPCTTTSLANCDTGLVQSTDGGQSWMPIPMPDATTAGAGFSNLYCEQGGPGTSCQGDYDQDIAAPAGSTGLVVGGIDLWGVASVPTTATGNGVTSAWTDLTNGYASVANTVHSDQHAIATLSASTWFIGNDGGVWATTDTGGAGTPADWANLNATLGNIQFYSVAADQASSGVWFGGAQDNGTSKLTGPGAAWTRFYLGDGGFVASDPTETSDYWLEYPDGPDIMMSSDEGGDMDNSPAQVVNSSTIPDAGDFYIPYQLVPASAPNSSFLAVGTCRVWVGPANPNSTGGLAWNAYSNDLTTGGSGGGSCAANGDYITDLAVAASNGNVAYAVTDDGQVQTTQNLENGAAMPAWTNVTGNACANCSLTGGLLPSSPTTPYSSVAINPINPSVAYLGVQGFGSGHVFKTSDGGQAWTDITGNLPDAPVNWILIDPLGPNNDIYIASDVGVFAATDGGVAGEQWTQVGSGLPDAAVLQLGISPSVWGSRQLVAATHGRGMWAVAPLPAPDFTLAASPSSQTVLTGAAAQFTVNATGENGEAGPLAYACTAPPSGCSVSPNSAPPGTPVTVSLAAGAIAAGANTVTLSATNEAGTAHTVSATVTGVPFTLSVAPAAQNAVAGSAATLAISAQGGSGFSGSIALACTAPASGCSFSPASISVGGSATLTVAAGALTDGANTITVSGVSGSTTQTAGASVTVQDFSVALGAPSGPVFAGSAAQLAVTTGAIAGFSGNLSLACTAPASGCTVAPATVAAGGSATVTVAAGALSAGANTVTVTATAGGLAHSASNTATVEDFTMSSPNSSATVAPGQSASYTVSLTAEGGFSGPVNLSCGGAPSEAACSVSPAVITPTAGGAAATVTVTTTAAGAVPPPAAPAGTGDPWLAALAVAALAVLAGALLVARRPRAALGTAGLLLLLMAAGCGGGNTAPAPKPNPGTPAGSYTLTVTGASGGLSHSTPLTLKVS